MDTEAVDYDEEPAQEVEAVKNSGGRQSKGRGHVMKSPDESDRGGTYDRIEFSESRSGAGVKSIEGWIIFVRNIHEEAQEDDIVDKFSEFGDVKNIQLNLDRRSGFVKGYALIEYSAQKDAQEAIAKMNGKKILDQPVSLGWAFVK